MKITILVAAILAAVSAEEQCGYTKYQGICANDKGGDIAMWRNMRKSECIDECNSRSECKSYVFAEGDAHRYTGTCHLYDSRASSADGNGGWSCYVQNKCSCDYNKHQGLCSAPRGNAIAMWRNTRRERCEKECDSRDNCRGFMYAEGEAHVFSGTCELYDQSAKGADGNRGWSCYSQECHASNDDHKHDGDNKDGNNTFLFEGPFLCDIPWLNCSRQMSDKEIITSEWEYFGLNMQCMSFLVGLFFLEVSDIILYYTECHGLDDHKKAECALRVFTVDYAWCTDHDKK